MPMNVVGMGVLRPAGCSRHQFMWRSCVLYEAAMVTGWRRPAASPAGARRRPRRSMTGSFPGVKRRTRYAHEPPFISPGFEREPSSPEGIGDAYLAASRGEMKLVVRLPARARDELADPVGVHLAVCGQGSEPFVIMVMAVEDHVRPGCGQVSP